MYSPQPTPASIQTSQPPLPPSLPISVLPPLPPGPPPEPLSTASLAVPPPVRSNNPIEKTAYLPYPGRAQECYGVELPFSCSFDYQYPPPPHPHTPDPFFQRLPYFPSLSVPPPVYPVAQPNFSYPPPLLNKPPPTFEQPLRVGIPFPPPGYDSSSIQNDSVSVDVRDGKLRRDSRRSRSKSTGTSPSRCQKASRSSKRRSRSPSFSHRKPRSRSRSRYSSITKSHHLRGRYSRSNSHGRRARVEMPRRSRSSSRGKRHRRSPNGHKRRSQSLSRTRNQSVSKSHNSRRSPAEVFRTKDRTRKRSQSSNRDESSSKRCKRSPKSRSPVHHSSASTRCQRYRSPSSKAYHKSSQRESKVDPSKRESNIGDADKHPVMKDEVVLEGQKNNDLSTGRRDNDSSFRENGETLASRRNGDNIANQQSKSERESLVERWRLNNCENLEEMANKLDVLSKMEADEIIELEKQTWTRSAPADLYYKRNPLNPSLMEATPKLVELCEHFDFELCQRATTERAKFSPIQPMQRKAKFKVCRHADDGTSSSSSSSCDSSSDDEDKAVLELERKRKHPQRLHPELWHNEPGEMNDGPLCRCSHRARNSGIRHNVYVGEQKLEKCNINTNNAGKLNHYRITMSPPVNFLTKTPTIIEHDSHEYIFEGFSLFSHFPLVKLPTCKVIRFNIEYTILYIDEATPENFTIRELDLFYNFLFHEILELVDLDLRAFGDPGGCNQFHFMPRFVRDLPENGKEILSMNEVLKYLLKSNKPLVPEERLNEIYNMSLYDWQTFADEVKCMVVTKPGMRPCSLRVDQLDRETMDEGRFPEIVHFGIRPPQLSYAGNTEYQKHWREYVKFRHLLANMPKPSAEDKRKLMGKENRLQEMRTVSKMKRDVTIALSSQKFYRTGIMCDIIQHALLLPVLVCHLRFHKSLDQLEEDMDYKFKNRYLLQLALTHPSYRENFGTNPDHARNSLTNCGIRQPEYGDRRIHYMNTRKRGINTLIQIMSRFGKKEATESNIGHNERLEFLGDAVVEFITSIHLFHLFPDLEEGGLATYRAAIVQNQHLAVMAKRLNLDAYMLYAHGSDLCHDLELRHAMANCFEALMGALFLDGGIETADKVFGRTLWIEKQSLTETWMNYPLHPLQEQEPSGDRQWIQHITVLQKLTDFENRTGIVFKHIRLLARAFTDRSVGYTNLTLGSNQRLEFLGDTVLQIIASEYLYKFFPEHHEGHLSLLRSSLVNNRTQAVVCDDLGMTEFALYANPKHDIKTKDRADLLEAYLGALYVDKGLKHCHLFCEVCFFPRLQDFIMNQDWNDPKSKLQQCCLTLRTMEGGEPDIPVYKVIQCMGPTNTRIYTVAVYFRGERLAQASGHSIQQAEMNAANEALELSTELFPQLDHQRRVIAKSMKKQKKRARREAALKAARELEIRAAQERGQSYRNQRDRRSRQRDDERERNKDKDQDRSRYKDRDIGRERYRNVDRDRDRYRDRGRDREREKCGERDHVRGGERCRRKERGWDQEAERRHKRCEKYLDAEHRGRHPRDKDSSVKDNPTVDSLKGGVHVKENGESRSRNELVFVDVQRKKERNKQKRCKGNSDSVRARGIEPNVENERSRNVEEVGSTVVGAELRHKSIGVLKSRASSESDESLSSIYEGSSNLRHRWRSESPLSKGSPKASSRSSRSFTDSSPLNSRVLSPHTFTQVPNKSSCDSLSDNSSGDEDSIAENNLEVEDMCEGVRSKLHSFMEEDTLNGSCSGKNDLLFSGDTVNNPESVEEMLSDEDAPKYEESNREIM